MAKPTRKRRQPNQKPFIVGVANDLSEYASVRVFAENASDALRRVQQYISTLSPRRQPALNSFVFLNQDRPLTRQFTWALINQYATKAGLNNVTPHTLRHAFATHLLENGASTAFVQALLGHQHITTTEIYTRVSTKHLRRSYDQHHPRARTRLSKKSQGDK